MYTSTSIDIIGYLAGGLTTICMLPQLIKIIYTDSNGADLSVPTFVCLILGQILWIAYGILITDIRIIIANVISCVLASCTVIVVILKRFKATRTIT